MIKNLLFGLAICVFSTSIFAQNTLQLNINHKLGNDDFSINQASENNLGNYFTVTRLEYYISEITITHDGGLETALEDVYILVNASETTEVDLGSYNINEVENINYHIGVDAGANHEDPAGFPNGHPLAPTFPSMHWGWAAGYRFVAFEGKSGSQNNQQTVELHCLGDSNYWESDIPVSASVENNLIVINIDADYNRVLEGIDVTTGLIVHGEGQFTKKAIENFRDFVFSPTPPAPIVAINIGAESEGGLYQTSASSDNTDDTFQWLVTDVDGNTVTTVDGPEFLYDFYVNGTYTITLTVTNTAGQQTIETQEVSITSAFAVGIEELANINGVQLYPVPAANFINLALTLSDAKTMNITVSNVLGQIVNVVGQNEFVSGENLIKINTDDFTNGIYLINIETDGQIASRRFVVNK